MKTFRAFRIGPSAHAPAGVEGQFVSMDETMLDAGDVLIRVAFSSINHQDALAGTGASRIVRRIPCVGGIDLAGTVVRSAAPRFQPGDKVIATTYELGVRHHGGYADYALVPGGWVLPLPAGLSLHDAMAIGTAGLAAGLAVSRMEDNGLKPENGPVIVTGATGGVGSLAVDMLAGRGYEVVALTGRQEHSDWLKVLGAARVVLRQEISPGPYHQLDKGRWAGALDTLGGNYLAWLLATAKPAGVVASVGQMAGQCIEATVLSFVLRGVSILGIDSVYAGFGAREKVWARLSSDLRPRHLGQIARTIAFDDLPDALKKQIKALATGRTVVQIAPAGNTEETL